MNKSRDWDGPAYKAWRLAVYRRDGFKCKMPGCSSPGGPRRTGRPSIGGPRGPSGARNLNAHHIRKWADNPELRFVVSNGITLCKMHHRAIWGKEEEFESLFQSLIVGTDLRLMMLMAKYGSPKG